MRGQTAFEYLLIIGGSVLLASIVLVFVQGNLAGVSPGINMSVGSINRFTSAVGFSCSDCDAVFVNEGQPQSITLPMIADDVSSRMVSYWTKNESDQYSTLNGSVGIGTNNPKTKLDVNGSVKLGTQTDCNPDSEGAMRYNSTSKTIEFCNGATWGPVSSKDYDWNASGTNQYSGVSGNVGIGTSNPGEKFAVVGNVNVTGNIKTSGSIQAASICVGSSGVCLSDITKFLDALPIAGGNDHNQGACTAAGGDLINEPGLSNPICRFNASSCPSGWQWYNKFCTSLVKTCGSTEPLRCSCMGDWRSGTTCTVGRSWGNNDPTCSYNAIVEANGCGYCATVVYLCYASITQIGCY